MTATAAAAIVTLAHDTVVRLPEWAQTFYCTVGTSEGYTASYGGDVEKALQRAKDNGHEIAWTVHTGSALVNDGGAHHRRQLETAAGAVTLVEGQEVEIEGRRYTVKLDARQRGKIYPQFSNPISFAPVA